MNYSSKYSSFVQRLGKAATNNKKPFVFSEKGSSGKLFVEEVAHRDHAGIWEFYKAGTDTRQQKETE